MRDSTNCATNCTSRREIGALLLLTACATTQAVVEAPECFWTSLWDIVAAVCSDLGDLLWILGL